MRKLDHSRNYHRKATQQAAADTENHEVEGLRRYFRGPIATAIKIAVPVLACGTAYYSCSLQKLDAELEQKLEANWPTNIDAFMKAMDNSIIVMRKKVEENEYLEGQPQKKQRSFSATVEPINKKLSFVPCLEYPKAATVSHAQILPVKAGATENISVSRTEKTIVFDTITSYAKSGTCMGSDTVAKTPHMIIRFSQNKSGNITDIQLMKADVVANEGYTDVIVVPLIAPDDMAIDLNMDAKTKEALMQKIGKLLQSMEEWEQWEKKAEETKKNYPANQAVALSKNDKLQKKIEGATVRILTMHSGSIDSLISCTGWIAAKDAIGTARHCVEDAETTRLLVRVDKVVSNGTQKAWFYPMYQPNSQKDYAIAIDYDIPDDIAVIVTRTPRFPEKNALQVRADTLVSGTYISGHLAGYTIPQFWKIDAGQISYSEISGVAPLQFNFPNQGGNSGGPIVDATGDVVSLHSKTKFHSPSQAFSCGPHITPKKIDTLVARARAELNPPKTKTSKK